MNHLEAIQKGLDEKRNHNDIVRKVYLVYPTYALIDDDERKYEIFNSISKYFSVSIMSIQVAGSAKVGHSFHKRRQFAPKESDLDIAIIDPALYLRYVEIVFNETRGYSDRTRFPVKNGVSTADEFLAYITKGIFRVDLMPSCIERANLNKFFGHLSRKNNDLFKNINPAIYMSQTFFESKQRSAIRNYQEYKAI